jgi:lysophospholipase L1-like esterase
MTSSYRDRATRRWPIAGAVSLVVLFLVTSCLALARQGTPPPFAAPQGSTQSLAGPGPTRPSALFVGDSFYAGSGTSGPDAAYACLTAQMMDWVCNLDAQGGTGYVADGSPNDANFGPFAERLPDDFTRYRADVIIVDGGRNDVNADVNGVHTAAANYLRAVRSNWPKATLVVVVPAYMASTPQNFPFGVELGQRLRDTLQPLGGILIDPMADGWIPATNVGALMSADGVHPNPDGHRYLAEHLRDELLDAGLGSLQVTDGRLGNAATTPPD